MNKSISRRTALAGGITGAGILTLAACGGSGGGSTDTAAAQPPGTDSGSSSTLATLDSITVGEAVAAQLDGKPVLVSRPTASSAACFSAICTHQGCTVAPAGKQLHCPCHGSVYDAATGAVISGPAPRALDRIPVAVDSGEVVPAT
jgi:nitrite reductase/ring-hydroxylating ferredoxin subunit